MQNASEIIKKVRKIELKTKGLSKQIFSGEYHSAFKGRGMSFSEVRDYQFGDDVRNIDWNVTARTGDPHIKIFEEERELTVMLLVDISKSSFFGTVNQFKCEYITEICAVLAFAALNNNDKVGAILFSSQVEKYIPPKKGKQHILRIIRELIYFKPEHAGTDIGEAIRYFNNLIKKRSIAFIFSDYLCDQYEDALKISKKRHDIIGVHVYDPIEKNLPDVGLIRAQDPETGKRVIIDSSSANFRRKYSQHFEDHYQQFQKAFMRLGLDTMSLKTEDDYIVHLMKFFKKRHHG
jgi:uncharacterized protein (DUF58 family)